MVIELTIDELAAHSNDFEEHFDAVDEGWIIWWAWFDLQGGISIYKITCKILKDIWLDGGWVDIRWGTRIDFISPKSVVLVVS